MRQRKSNEERTNQRLLVDLPRAADGLGIKRSALYKLLAANRLESVHIGRRRLVVWSSLERLVEELRAEARDAAVREAK
jgi:excisionase family DNA binding protein